ncbi:MAG: response regulator [Steroidobacterales bacterium]
MTAQAQETSPFVILYVEDDPDIRELVTVALELEEGVRVVGCQTGGDDAVEMARAWHPQVILLDVMLPGTDGPRTLELLRADPATRGIPAIFITAKAATSDVSRLNGLGALGVIRKPFDPMTLLAKIRELIGAAGHGTAPVGGAH